MRRIRLAASAVVLTVAAATGLGVAPAADAAPPGPQCIRECGPPTDIVEKIIRTCQTAYCQFP